MANFFKQFLAAISGKVQKKRPSAHSQQTDLQGQDSAYSDVSDEKKPNVHIWGFACSGKTTVLAAMYHFGKAAKSKYTKASCFPVGKLETVERDIANGMLHPKTNSKESLPSANVPFDQYEEGMKCVWTDDKNGKKPLISDLNLRIVSHAGEDFSLAKLEHLPKTGVKVLVVSPFLIDYELAKSALLKTAFKLHRAADSVPFITVFQHAAEYVFGSSKSSNQVKTDVRDQEENSTRNAALISEAVSNLRTMLESKILPGANVSQNLDDVVIKIQKDEKNAEGGWTFSLNGHNATPDLMQPIDGYLKSATSGVEEACRKFLDEADHAILVFSQLDKFSSIFPDGDVVGSTKYSKPGSILDVYLDEISNVLLVNKGGLDGRIVRLNIVENRDIVDFSQDAVRKIGYASHKGFLENPTGLGHLWRAIEYQHKLVCEENEKKLRKTSCASIASLSFRMWWTFVPMLLFTALLAWTLSKSLPESNLGLTGEGDFFAKSTLPPTILVPFSDEFKNFRTAVAKAGKDLESAEQEKSNADINLHDQQRLLKKAQEALEKAKSDTAQTAVTDAQTAVTNAQTAVGAAPEKLSKAQIALDEAKKNLDEELGFMAQCSRTVAEHLGPQTMTFDCTYGKPSYFTTHCIWYTFLFGTLFLFAWQMLALVVHGPRLFAELYALFSNRLSKNSQHRF